VECPNGCLSPMEERKEEKLFHRNGEPIVISDLTMYVCPDCGQESMPLSSARIVEDILKGIVKPSGRFTA
jgi:YgiT-type zinc finger domain-containing protein